MNVVSSWKVKVNFAHVKPHASNLLFVGLLCAPPCCCRNPESADTAARTAVTARDVGSGTSVWTPLTFFVLGLGRFADRDSMAVLRSLMTWSIFLLKLRLWIR